MPSMRHTSKPRTRPLLVVLLLLLVFSAALMLILPQAQALADTIPLSINIKNSNIYTITLKNNGGPGEDRLVDVALGKYPKSVAPPEQKDGYLFQGYFDDPVGGTQYYNINGDGAIPWDKNSDTKLYAHWALEIQCTFPTKALVQVDAAGNITGQKDLEFSSTSAGAIKVTAVESSRDTGADSLFANEPTIDGTHILLTPQTLPAGSTVQVPLKKATTPIEGGWTIAAGTISNPSKFLVDFSLSLPSNAQLNYLAGDGEVSVANLTYVVQDASLA